MTPTIPFREMSPLAQARHIQQLMAANGWTLTQVAAYLGEYASFLSFRLALLDLPAERQALLEGGGLSIAQALREVRGLPAAPSLKPAGAGAATGQLSEALERTSVGALERNDRTTRRICYG